MYELNIAMIRHYFQTALVRLRDQAVIFLPITILIVGTALSAWSSYYVYQLGSENDRLAFEKQVEYVDLSIRDYIDTNMALLNAGRGFFNAKNSVTAADFKTFISSYRLEQKYRGVQGIGFAKRIEAAQLPQIEAVRRAEGATGFSVYPTYARDEFTAILYIHPESERNLAALGYDMFSDPSRQTAMAQARDTGEVALTRSVTLIQELDSADIQKGFLLYLPIYRTKTLPLTVDERRAQLEGYIYSVFRAGDFFEGVFKGRQTPQVEFVVYDSDELTADNILYDSRLDKNYQPIFTELKPFSVADHRWMIAYTNTPTLEVNSERGFVPYVIFGGMLSTLTLFFATRSLIQARIEAEQSESALLKSQLALEESEEHMRLLIQGAHEYAILMLDPTGIVMSWNEGAQKLFQYSESEIIGHHFSQLYPPQQQRRGKPERVLREVLKKGLSQEEKIMQRKDGTTFWSSGTLTALYDASGRLRGIAKIARDVSSRKSAERSLKQSKALTQAVLDSLSAYIAVLDPDGTIIATNDNWSEFVQQVYAEAPAALTIGSNYLHVLSELKGTADEAEVAIKNGITAVLNGEKERYSREYSVGAETNERWYLLTATSLRHSAGGVVIASTDITRRKQLERQKEEFLSIASHELKTPLTSIKAYTQVLLRFFEKRRDEKAVTLLKKMDRQMDKMTHLVSDLLDVTKIQAGRMQLEVTTFEMSALLKEVVELLQLTSEEHTIVITGLEEETFVSADRERVAQVITNFLTNAIKYSPEGKKVIVKLEADATTVTVRVQDFGIGIPEEQRSALFKRFSRLEGPQYTTFPGLGLGLYISSELIQRMGGTIGVESTVGAGSTFYFVLPCTSKE